MEISEKEIYKALKFYMGHDREYLDEEFARVLKGKNSRKDVSNKVEARIRRMGYVAYSITHPKLDLLHDDYVITLKGYDKFCELRQKYRDTWTHRLAILALILSLIGILIGFLQWWLT